MNAAPPDFTGFPKMARLSRECVISEKHSLTSCAFSPYFVYGNNSYVPAVQENRDAQISRAKTKVLFSLLPTHPLGKKQSSSTQQVRSGIPRQEIRKRRKMEGRGRESCRAQGMDGRNQIKAVRGLRGPFPCVLYGFRPPGWHKESLQHWEHVRSSLQPRTYQNRIGQMRLGLLQLPQNTNPR